MFGAIGMVAMGTGSVLSMVGSRKAGKAEARAAKFAAALDRRAAAEARALTDYRVRMIHEAGAELQGAVEAETGKGGLAMTGTPLATLVDNARKIELSAALEVRGGRITEQNYLTAAEAGIMTGNAAEQAGNYNAFSYLLQGIGGISNAAIRSK